MTKAQQILKKINETKREINHIQNQKRDAELRVGHLNEELWRLEGMLEEEQDEHEYRQS
jgi:hypothetical protein